MKRVRRAVVSVVGYVLRQTSRPTPFGLFAGVAPVEFGPATKTRWGPKHSAVVRADAEWLAEVIAGLEACPELLERLTVTVNNLRSVRGGRLVRPSGTACVEIRHTPAVRAVERAARAPIRFGALVDAIAVNFPEAGSAKVRGMLTELVAQGFLVTSLRPAATVTDPLAHVIDRLREAQADEVAPVASTMRELRAVHDDLDRHNHTDPPERRQARASLVTRMRGLSRAANRRREHRLREASRTDDLPSHPARSGVNLCSAAAAGCAPHGAPLVVLFGEAQTSLPARGRPFRRPARTPGALFVPKADAIARVLTSGVVACGLTCTCLPASLWTWQVLARRPLRVCSAKPHTRCS